MLLFMSPTSPYSRKVRIVLREKALGCEEVDHNESERKPATVNPLAKVPTLLLDDGTPIFDSVVITETLEALFPNPPLIPADPVQRMKVRRWEALADGLCDALIPVVLESRRPAERRDDAYMAKLEGKVRATLGRFEEQLGGRRFAHGDTFTLADAAVVSAVGYVALRRPELLEPCRVVRAYADSLLSRPSIANTVMPNLPIRG